MAEEALLLSAVSGLIAQASDGSLRRVTQSWRIEKQRLHLEKLLVAMKKSPVLAKAELKADKDPAIRDWVQKFKPTVRDAHDVLNMIKSASEHHRQPALCDALDEVVDKLFELADQVLQRGLLNPDEPTDLEAGNGQVLRRGLLNPDEPTDLEAGNDQVLRRGLLNPDEPIDLEAGNGQVVPAADDQIEQQKRCSKYSTKALGFALTTLVAYLGSASSSSGNAFKVAMAAYIIAVAADLFSATKMKPMWGSSSAWVYVSSFLLMLVSYLLLVTFNKAYAYAILPVLLLTVPIVVAFLQQRKQRQQRSSSNDEADGEELDRIFKLSAGIVNGGGLITMILGHYMVRPNHHVSAVGFLFFFIVVLGLYLMMATTVRTAVLTRYARHLAYLQMTFLIGTIIAILIYGSFPR